MPQADAGSTNSNFGWLRKLSGRLAEDSQGNGPSNTSPATPSRSPFQEARADLLARISNFLLDNDLDVTAENLALVQRAFSGADLVLARELAKRETEQMPITQDWLNGLAAAEQDPNEQSKFEKLAARLESSIDTFTSTTRNARSAASDYRNVLGRHAETAQGLPVNSEVVANLAALATAMLEHTRQVEEDMKRSEREAASLRKNLERARRDAQVDHLTGLPNRRAFESLLEVHYRDARREIEPLSVAFCDIDHFKQVNDTHGHDTGDRVIQAISQVLSRISNDKCHVARHGGEEFVMLFRGMTKFEAKEKLDQARRALSERRFVNRANDQPIGRITFSGGVADVFAYSDARAALRAADQALYRAKDLGRNRIELS